MPEPITDLPDTLVLGGGGTLGEAWMRGLLAGLESTSGLDFRGCEYVLGTSAGSIVAAALVSGRRLEAGDRAARAWGAAAEAGEAAARASGAAAGDGAASGEADRGARGIRYLARAALRAGTAAASPLAPLAFAGLEPAGRIARSAALAATPRTERRL